MVIQKQKKITGYLSDLRRRKQLMGWVPFIVAVAHLIFSIWEPGRSGKLAQVKTVVNSLLLFKPQETQKHVESLCPLGECFREKG